MTTVVFGSRGSVGRNVVAGLHALGIPCRVARRGALADPAALSASLQGARRVFLYAVPSCAPYLGKALVDAGVQRAVLLSSSASGCPPDRMIRVDFCGHRCWFMSVYA